MALPENSELLQRMRKNAGQLGKPSAASSRPTKATVPSQSVQNQQLQFMQQVNLFENLNSLDLQVVAQHLVRRRFREADLIFHEGDPGELLYLVEVGQVRIFVHGLGSGIETSVILCGRPGDIFGELAIVDGLPRSASAQAMEDTIVYTIARDDFRQLMRRFPQLALNFMRLLSIRVRYNTKQVNSLASMSVNSRLARMLLKLAQDYGEVESKGVRINTNLNQTDIASLIGATRESTNKALRLFRREGLLETDNGQIIIIDPEALRKKVSRE